MKSHPISWGGFFSFFWVFVYYSKSRNSYPIYFISRLIEIVTGGFSYFLNFKCLFTMKKIYLLAAIVLFGTLLFAQQASYNLPLDQRMKRASLITPFLEQSYDSESSLLSSQPMAPSDQVAKTQTAIQLGRASNIYTCTRPQQNQVYVDNDLDLVAFIHRQDVTVWGGGTANNGKLRLDISVDGGNSFTTEIGELNVNYTRPARYPNLTGFNPNNATNPFNTFLAYSAPTLNGAPSWDGHVTGIVPVAAAPPVQPTETYSLLSSQTLLQGGLTEGLDNEFWTAELQYDGANTPGDIYINKGVYLASQNDIVWNRADTISPPHYTGYNGSPVVRSPNIAFSPDGNTGWIAWIGDLIGGQDSTLRPIFMKSTDGGASWGTPIEVDLNADPAVASYLTELWTQVDSSTGNTVPVSTGIASTSLDFDITVDMNGNPHMAVVIGSASVFDAPEPGYFFYYDVAKFLGDVWSPDGGATWNTAYIAPVLAWRGSFGANNPINMDNYCQISRTPSGDHVFYSWVDSDTSANTGSMNGIGFGVSDNLAPNLRISAMRVQDAYQMCYIRVTDGDLLWDGRMMFPTMAPEVLLDAFSNEVTLPIVNVEMLNNEPDAPVQFHYFGDDSKIDLMNTFVDPSSLNLAWDVAPCIVVGTENPMESGLVILQSVPNPTDGETMIQFELPFASEVSLDLSNSFGQQVMQVEKGSFSAGRHQLRFDTEGLASGIYYYTLRAGEHLATKKMIIGR